MEIFVSSVIGGMENFRDAVARAIRTLKHNVVRAEDFPASPESPRAECLRAARESDAMVLIIGERYGDKQESGLSATHEEYRAARNAYVPVLVMVQKDVEREDSQNKLLQEARDWEDGLYTGSFDSPDELYENTIWSLHELIKQQERGPTDSDEILERALAVLSEEEQLRLYHKLPSRPWIQGQEHYFQRISPQSPQLALSLSCGPSSVVLRPASIESSDFRSSVRAITLRGNEPLFTMDDGAQTTVDGGDLIVLQENRFVRINEHGTITYVTTVMRPNSLLVIIEDDVKEEIGRFIEFAKCTLDQIDDSSRLSHCGIAALLLNATYCDWKSRAQHQQNPNMSSVPLAFSSQPMQPVNLSSPIFPRRGLMPHKSELAEELTIKLGRKFYP